MIARAVILLPDRPGEAFSSEGLGPLDRVAGLTLIQRSLYNAQRAGIEQGIVLSFQERPDVETLIRKDPKIEHFTWITIPKKNSQDAETLKNLLCHDFLLQTPYWIVDRQALADICAEQGPLETVTLFTTSPEPLSPGSQFPPLALVPGRKSAEFAEAFEQGVPLEEIGRLLDETGSKTVKPLAGQTLIRAVEREDRAKAEQQLFKGLIKPTESFLSQKFERRISLAITRRLPHTRITPNQISVGSLMLGLLSALCFLSFHKALHVAGAFMLLLSSIVDGCDGEMARLRYQESKAGSWLDFLGDNLVHIGVFICIGLGLYLRGAGTVYLWLGGLGALSTLAAASAVFLRVFLTSGSSVITFATPVRVEEMNQAQGRLRNQIEFADKISNRDFIYLILVLAILGQLWIWPWISAVGSTFYLANLLYIYHRMAAMK